MKPLSRYGKLNAKRTRGYYESFTRHKGLMNICEPIIRSSTDNLPLFEKIGRIRVLSLQEKLSPIEQKEYQELVQSFLPWARKILRSIGKPRTEDNLQEVLTQFLEIIRSGVESAYWIFEARIKDHFREQDQKPKRHDLKQLYQEQQEAMKYQENRTLMMASSLSTFEKNLITFALDTNREQLCRHFQMSRREYDQAFETIKRKLEDRKE